MLNTKALTVRKHGLPIILNISYKNFTENLLCKQLKLAAHSTDRAFYSLRTNGESLRD